MNPFMPGLGRYSRHWRFLFLWSPGHFLRGQRPQREYVREHFQRYLRFFLLFGELVSKLRIRLRVNRFCLISIPVRQVIPMRKEILPFRHAFKDVDVRFDFYDLLQVTARIPLPDFPHDPCVSLPFIFPLMLIFTKGRHYTLAVIVQRGLWLREPRCIRRSEVFRSL
jgi:hypothetical protein